MNNINELLEKLDAHNSNKVKFAVTDIDGILRGKIISRKKIFKEPAG